MSYFVIEPIARLLHIISFIPMDGVNVPRKGATIYDARWARMDLMSVTTKLIFLQCNFYKSLSVSDLPTRDTLIDGLVRAYMKLVIDFYQKEDIAVGDDAVLNMYKEVASLHSQNTSLSKYVQKMNKIFVNRQSDVTSMFRNQQIDKRKYYASIILFVVWLIAFIMLIGSSLFMVGFKKYDNLLIQSYIVIGLVTTIIVAEAVYKVIISRFPTFGF